MAIKIRREGEGIAEREFMGDPPTYDTFRDKVLAIRHTATCLIPPFVEEGIEDGIKRSIALAKKILKHSDRLLKALRDGNAEQIGWLAFELGELYEQLIIKCHWEEHALRGRKVKRGQHQGGQSRWEKYGFKGQAKQMQAAINSLRADKPNLSYSRMCKLVADRFHCSRETVKRYTTNSR